MRVLVLLLLSMSSLFHGSNAKKPPLVGGSHPIKNLKDPHILEIANFAVSEHNKESKSNLVFQRLVGGKIGVVEGLEYHLIIEAKDVITKLCRYEAVVWEREWLNFRQLISFKVLNKKKKPEVLLAWKPVENLEKDMHILEIARYAVLEHNKELQAEYHDHDDHLLVLEKVVSGESKGVVLVDDHDQGVKYRLVISAMDGAKYEALVWEKTWLNFRRLISFKPLT